MLLHHIPQVGKKIQEVYSHWIVKDRVVVVVEIHCPLIPPTHDGMGPLRLPPPPTSRVCKINLLQPVFVFLKNVSIFFCPSSC